MSPESPPNEEQKKEHEEMTVDISPASPTMEDIDEPESLQLGSSVTEIPLSSSYPLSPKVLIVPPQVMEMKSDEATCGEKGEMAEEEMTPEEKDELPLSEETSKEKNSLVVTGKI